MVSVVVINGKVEKNARVEITTQGVEPPPPNPTPPVDPRFNLGELTKPIPKRVITINRGDTVSYFFYVPVEGNVPALSWGYAPQQQDGCNFRIWISETPGGTAVNINARAQTIKKNVRVGGQLGMFSAIVGRGANAKLPRIHHGRNYYMNIKVTGGASKAVVNWRLGGDF